MDDNRLNYLYQQYIDQVFTDQELEELTEMLNDPAYGPHLVALMDQTWDKLLPTQLQDVTPSKANDVYFSIIANGRQTRKVFNYRIGIAAILFLSVVFGVYFFTTDHATKRAGFIAQKAAAAEVIPGEDKAFLTLGNGRKVVLDDSKNGEIASQQGVLIRKNKNGLVYAAAKTAGNNPAAINASNTITVPRGGQYHFTMSDGTQVFLNAASALTFPAKFAGTQRAVILKGEAYFEVAKNPKIPFKVNVAGKQEIEVLGTHFNVKAYADESTVNTTLLEGSVKITASDKQALLKPGQTAVNDPAKNIVVKTADLDEVMAWKNGGFIFNNENIVGIMQKVSRWYNVDVFFKGNMQDINFTGNYSRAKSLNNLLKNIELINKIHFKVEGRSVTVIAG